MGRRKKIEPLMDTEYHALDRIFNAGWDEFVKNIREDNDRCNYRLLRLVEKISGELFVTDLKILLKRVDHGMLRVVRKPIGLELKENRFATIPKIWVDQKYIDGQTKGSICVQVKDNRWIVAYYIQ